MALPSLFALNNGKQCPLFLIFGHMGRHEIYAFFGYFRSIKKGSNIERMRCRQNRSQRKRPVKRLLDDVLLKKRPHSKSVVNPELTVEEEDKDAAQEEKDQSNDTSNEAMDTSSLTLKRNEEKKESDQ